MDIFPYWKVWSEFSPVFMFTIFLNWRVWYWIEPTFLLFSIEFSSKWTKRIVKKVVFNNFYSTLKCFFFLPIFFFQTWKKLFHDFSSFFLVHPEEIYQLKKNYELHLSRRLETAVARLSSNRLMNLQWCRDLLFHVEIFFLHFKYIFKYTSKFTGLSCFFPFRKNSRKKTFFWA